MFESSLQGGPMSDSVNKKVAKLLMYYRDNPVEAIEQLFNIQLDNQQKDLVLSAHSTHARVAVKSCQGAGKTFTLVCLVFYYLLTLEDCRILVTSPSSSQLRRVFASELLKVHSMMIEPFASFFEIMKETVYIKGKPQQCANLVTASVANQENLAGGHSKSYIVLADESSALEEKAFDTLLGTLGSSQVTKFILTSNPVRNSGRFYEIFANENPRWTRLTFNAFDSAQTSPEWIKDIEAMYGIDSDNYRVRVLGSFGRFGSNQFFSADKVDEAVKVELKKSEYVSYPIVAGCDFARYGTDSTVFILRQGPKILDIEEHKGLSTMEVSSKMVDYYHRYKPSSMLCDGTGLGAGVVDRCIELGLPIVDVVVGSKSSNPRTYSNLRSQLYGEMSTWLDNGADIPDNSELISQFNSASYTYNSKMQIQLMTKKDIKRQGLPSPDMTDALSLSFAAGAYGFIGNSVKSRKVARVIRSNWV